VRRLRLGHLLNLLLEGVVERMIFTYINLASINRCYMHKRQARERES